MLSAKRLTKAAGAQEGSPPFPSGSRFHCHSWTSSRAQGRPFPSQPLPTHRCLGLGLRSGSSSRRPAKTRTRTFSAPSGDPNPSAFFLCCRVRVSTFPKELEPLPITARAAEPSGNCSPGSPSPNVLPGSARSAAIVPRADVFCLRAPRSFGG